MSHTLPPVTLPDKVPVAPSNVLEMIRCGCCTGPICSTLRCSCAAAEHSCTVFCVCGVDSQCMSKSTIALCDSDSSDNGSVADDDELEVE